MIREFKVGITICICIIAFFTIGGEMKLNKYEKDCVIIKEMAEDVYLNKVKEEGYLKSIYKNEIRNELHNRYGYEFSVEGTELKVSTGEEVYINITIQSLSKEGGIPKEIFIKGIAK